MALSERTLIENYLKEYCIQDCLDEVINEIVEKRPSNPYMHISKFMETKTHGEILDIKLRTILTARGCVGVESTVTTNFTTFSASFPVNGYANSGGGDALLDFSMAESKVKESLIGLDPTNIPEVDAAILSASHVPPPVACAISMSCCRAGARHSSKPLYQFLADLMGTTPRLPAPVVSVVGRAAGGGINVAQVVTCVPSTPSFFEGAIESTIAVSRCVQAKLYELRTPSTIPDMGVPVVLSDTPLEELIELVSAAISEEGVEGVPKLGLDYRATDLMTPAIGEGEEGEGSSGAVTYQLEGQEDEPVDGETLAGMQVAMWRKTGLITLEDPLSNKDSALDDFNTKFEESIRDIRDNLLSDCAYNLKGVAGDSKCNLQLIADADITCKDDIGKLNYPYNTCKVGLLGGNGSILAALEMCKAVKESSLCLVVGVREGFPETEDAFIADFAVACACSQYYGGGINCAEYTSKYTRLLEIANENESLKYIGKSFRS
eukprot:GSChrysophyteH1.ASY1.ANO1.752.1 assembled CDS